MMNAPMPASLRFDPQALIQAVNANQAMDKLTCPLSVPQWETLMHYLQPFPLTQGQVLIEQGSRDRQVYLVEQGMLSVHLEDDKGRLRMAMLGAGSVVGEGSFFSAQPRHASVQAANPAKLWCLTQLRFTEMGNRHPAIALQLSMALAGVMARRLLNGPKRVAIT